MRDIGELRWFLGVRVVRDRARRRLWLCQDAYITKMAAKFGLANQSPIRTPMVQDAFLRYKGRAEQFQIARYQTLVGSINYPAIITRPHKSTLFEEI